MKKSVPAFVLSHISRLKVLVLFVSLVIFLSHAPSHAMEHNPTHNIEQEKKEELPEAVVSSDHSESDSDGYYYSLSSYSLSPKKQLSPLQDYREGLNWTLREWPHEEDKSDGLLSALLQVPRSIDVMSADFCLQADHMLFMDIEYEIEDGTIDPNEINSKTGNTTLADFFMLNNSSSNSYFIKIVLSLVGHGARLYNITHDKRSFYDLIGQARTDNNLTEKEYIELCEDPKIASHFKEALARNPRARRIKTPGPAIFKITEDDPGTSDKQKEVIV